MKKLTLSLLAAASILTAAAANTPAPLLYGYVAEADAGRQTGFYSITPTAEPEFQLMSKNIVANGGGDFIGEVLYCVKAYASWSGVGENIDIESYNSDTWQRIALRYGKQRNKSTDLVYDPTTQTTYGCFFTNDGSGYEYATMDFTTQTRNDGVALGSPYNAMAIDADGTLYAIDMNGYLYRALDKEKGIMSAIGNTGVVPRDVTSGCIDRRSGRFFWTVRNADGAFLYEVDKTTAKATQIAKLPYNERITALCIKTPAVDYDAPDAVTDLTTSFVGGSLTGTVSFKMPSLTFGCDALSGSLSYKVTDGTTTLAEGQAEAGSTVNASVTVPKAGKYELHVTAANTVGSGPATKASLFIGPDKPVVPVPTASYADGNITISWQPVTEGVNGGYVDPAAITYKVVRKQDSKIVAESTTANSVTDPVEWPSEITIYTYTVTATYAGTESATATTPKVVIGEIVPPVSETFDSMASLDPFTIIDGNNDRSMWSVGGKMAQVSGGSKMDDWLITPPIRLEAGKIYDFSIDARCYSSYAERMEVKFGNAPTAEGMTEELIPLTDITKNTMTTFNGRLTAPADGLFYIGIHSCGDDPFTLYVDNLTLSTGVMPAAPAAPSGFTAVAASNGERKVSLTFTTPTLDVNGDALESLTKAEIYCGETLVTSVEKPGLGKEITFAHTAAPAGLVKYTAVAWNGAAKGKEAEAEVFVGFNKPIAPANVGIVEKDGKVTLTWDAVTADIDGKVLSSDDVTYTIYSLDEDRNPIVVEDNIKTLTHTHQAVTEGQRYIYFAVGATTEGGSSDATNSPYTPVGIPYSAPYHETFANGSAVNIHGITRLSGNCTWSIFDDSRMQGIASFEGDGGYLALTGSEAGDAAEIATGKISLEGVKNAALTFNAFNYVSSDYTDDNTIEVFVNAGDGYASLGKTKLSTLPSAGWNRVVTDLSAYDGKTVTIKLRGEVVVYPQTHIDNMRVMTMSDNNLTASIDATPAHFKANNTLVLTAGVENTGKETTQAYTFNCYANGVKVASATGRALQPGAYEKHNVNVVPTVANSPEVVYTAEVVYDTDSDVSDNTAASEKIIIDVPGYAVPTALTGNETSAGNVLTWTAPDLTESLPASKTEDFEGFTSFGMEGEAGWSFADVDGAIVSGIQGFELPNIPAPGKGTLSWFVLNSDWSGFLSNVYAAADGKKYLSNMCLWSGGTVDDRAISPELYGGAQTISLLARSFTAEYPETLEVMASSTGTANDDFTTIATFRNLSSKWSPLYIDLPEGTRYFALRAVSKDAFMLHLDRVEFIPAGQAEELVLKGYNVYRNGVKVNNEVLPTAEFTDAAPAGTHSYAVSAVYDKGESGLSDKFDMTTSSISSITGANVIVETTAEAIIIKNAAGLDITVASTDGRVIDSFRAQSNYEYISVVPGIYVIRTGATASKAIVR